MGQLATRNEEIDRLRGMGGVAVPMGLPKQPDQANTRLPTRWDRDGTVDRTFGGQSSTRYAGDIPGVTYRMQHSTEGMSVNDSVLCRPLCFPLPSIASADA